MSAEQPSPPPSAPDVDNTVASQKAASADVPKEKIAVLSRQIHEALRARFPREKSAGPLEVPPLPETAQGKQQMTPPPAPLQGPAAGKLASAFKAALKKLAERSDLVGSLESDGLPVAEPEMDPAAAAFLQQEQEGMATERANEESFYKQRFQQAAQQLQALQQQASQLEQQVSQTSEQQQQVLSQAQQIQQAAMQNSQAAHAAATQAMQQTLASQKQELQQAQLAVGMRDAVHGMRQGLLELVQQQLPPATPAEAGAIQADMMAQQQGLAGGDPAMAGGQDNSQQPVAEGAAAGQPAAAPDPGTPPTSPSPGAAGPDNSPTAGAGAAPTMQNAQPQGQAGMAQGQPKTAADRLIGAIMGGALGAGGSLLESKMSNDPLRQKVKDLQAKEDAGGGFFNAANLAQAKARLALGELAEKHPGGAAMMGGALGAMTGAGAAPSVRDLLGG